MLEFFNQTRFAILNAHQRMWIAVRKGLTWQNLIRVAGTLLIIWQSNWFGVRAGMHRQLSQNWNGSEFVEINDEALAAINNLAEDSGAIVDVYGINYRLPGFYKGISSSSGRVPRDRYLSRDFLWQQLQRSECVSSDKFADSTDLRSEFEVYCPINYGELSLPVGFILMRWSGGYRPNSKQIDGYSDRLFDTGRLISR